MRILLLTTAFAMTATTAFAAPYCVRPVISEKTGLTLYCTRDLSIDPTDDRCGCGPVATAADNDGPSMPSSPRPPGFPVDPDDDKQPPVDPKPPVDPVDPDPEPEEPTDPETPVDPETPTEPEDPVDPPKDPKPDHPKPEKPVKDNSGLGNGDEGDCRGKGCSDADNPGGKK